MTHKKALGPQSQLCLSRAYITIQLPGANSMDKRERRMGGPLWHSTSYSMAQWHLPLQWSCELHTVVTINSTPIFAKRKHRLLRTAQTESRRVRIRTQTENAKAWALNHCYPIPLWIRPYSRQTEVLQNSWNRWWQPQDEQTYVFDVVYVRGMRNVITVGPDSRSW